MAWDYIKRIGHANEAKLLNGSGVNLATGQFAAIIN
jgi:hypothetical protein